MTRLERCYFLLLHAYPAWYRRDRAEEILGTLAEASPPDRKWPSLRDARALVIGGLHARGRVWCLSALWVLIGAAGSGYAFLVSTRPYVLVGHGAYVPAWIGAGSAWAGVIYAGGGLAFVAFLLLPIPVVVAGFARLGGWTPGNTPRSAAWAGAWVTGCALMLRAYRWGQFPLARTCDRYGCSVTFHGSTAPSWGELGICAAWLAVWAGITFTLARPAHDREMSDARTPE
jgi:hypothetical protein